MKTTCNEEGFVVKSIARQNRRKITSSTRCKKLRGAFGKTMLSSEHCGMLTLTVYDCAFLHTPNYRTSRRTENFAWRGCVSATQPPCRPHCRAVRAPLSSNGTLEGFSGILPRTNPCCAICTSSGDRRINEVTHFAALVPSHGLFLFHHLR